MAEKPRSRIYWRSGKAYGDFRDFADVGGRREALKPAGMRVPTTDPDVAAKLSTDRVAVFGRLAPARPQVRRAQSMVG